MKLARLVPFVSDWAAAYNAGKMPHRKPPLWALASLQPSEKDNNKPSFYRTDEAITPGDIAAALAFRRSLDQAVFVVVDESALTKAGFVIEDTAGQTNHPAINARHVEIEIKDARALTGIASVFLKGEVVVVDKAEITKTLHKHARSGAIDWSQAAKDGPPSVEKHLREFIKKGSVRVSGADALSQITDTVSSQ